MKLAQFAFRKEEASPAPAEDGRVVELFRSRSELRKQHEDLRADLDRQRDRLKQQEAATQRVRDLLEALERRLGQADTGFPALAFYHLRALWADGRELIQAFVTDLANKQAEREREVLDLLAAGLTNIQIGEKLFISANTVKRHLKAVFEKLGVNNRAAAAALVTRESR